MAGAGETGERQVTRALSGGEPKVLGEGRRYAGLDHAGPIVVVTGSSQGKKDGKDDKEKPVCG